MWRLLILLLLLSHVAFAQNYESLRVNRIDVLPQNLENAVAFDARQVRTRLNTKMGNLFSQQEFDSDLKMLSEEYDRVDPLIHMVEGEIQITLKVWFKPHIRQILFCGNDRVQSSKLKKKLAIKEGELFEREEFIESFNKLRTFYVKKGYFESALDYDLIPVDGGNEVDIMITVCEGTAGKIKKICFVGLTGYEENALLEMMVTKRHYLLLSWVPGSRGCYHPDMIEHDRLQILDYFQNKGYADATVALSVEECAGGITLMITVDKSQRYHIGHMNMRGNSIFTNEQIWGCFTFGRGSFYSPYAVRESVQKITDLYGGRGYIDASVEMRVRLRTDSPVYDSTLVIEEGKRYHVGLIKVFGNTCTQTPVILHENMLTPGDVFDVRKLKATETRLTNTGYFKNVNVYALQSQLRDYEDGQYLYRDLFVEVEEADTGSIGLSLAFSSLDQLAGGFEINERNFNIMGLTHLMQCGPHALRGGGEYAHAKISVGTKETSYIFQWTKPHFLDSNWIIGFDLEKSDNRVFSSGYEIKTYGGSTHATYILNDFLKSDFFYRAKHQRTAVGKTSSIELENVQGSNEGFLSSVGLLLIYDDSDHPRRPSKGFRSNFLYELYGVGGNYEFMKFCYYNSYYVQVLKDTVFKLRCDFQFIHKYGGTTTERVPLSERFFLGGETTVRGIYPFQIGPKFDNYQPTGGLSSFLFSEELQYTLCKCPFIDLFSFIDAGAVNLKEFSIRDLVTTLGFGTRIEVMKNTPLMFGIGWPIHSGQLVNGDVIDISQRFFFAMGTNF